MVETSVLLRQALSALRRVILRGLTFALTILNRTSQLVFLWGNPYTGITSSYITRGLFITSLVSFLVTEPFIISHMLAKTTRHSVNASNTYECFKSRMLAKILELSLPQNRFTPEFSVPGGKNKGFRIQGSKIDTGWSFQCPNTLSQCFQKEVWILLPRKKPDLWT